LGSIDYIARCISADVDVNRSVDDTKDPVRQYVSVTLPKFAPTSNEAPSLWWIAVIVLAVGGIVLAIVDASEFVVKFPLAIALFLMGRREHRVTPFGAATMVTLASVVVSTVLDEDPFWSELAGEVATTLLPLSVGYALRLNDLRMQESIEREAESRVAAERLRLARDLHDVVAHSLSTIAVQSGVAAHVADNDPEQVKEALSAINNASKESLEELRAMVGVLRSTDTPSLEPAPTHAAELESLITAAERNGLQVAFTTTGSPPPNSTGSTAIATHRIVQEALTNVARHAGAVETRVDVKHGPDAVRIVVENAPNGAPPPPVESTGVGITGMTERAELLGGTLKAGAMTSGGFKVEATIPYGRGWAAP